MTDTISADAAGDAPAETRTPILRARRLVKTFGRVVGLDGVSLELYPGEVLAIIGDNGAGKSTLIKCLTGAEIPDEGEIFLDGKPVHFKRPQDAHAAGIETVYQNLAVSPALDVAANLFLGREVRKKGILGSVFRVVDQKGMRQKAKDELKELGISTLQDVTVPVENLSGGQRQAVAVARAAAFGSKVVVLDEPTAALGVRESNQVLELIKNLRDRGIPVILISHNMPQVFDVAANLFLGREERKRGILGSVFRVVDQKGMREKARAELKSLGISTLQDVTVPVENLSGGQRQAVAVARAAAFGSKVVVLDEPTAALGVRESNQVLELIRNLRERGIPVILISHNMPHVFDVADRIHIQRLGKRAATITPQSHTMTDAVAIMTGALRP